MKQVQASNEIKYNTKQLHRVMEKVRERKVARQMARDEEKCYVEYRKHQVLSSIQPKVGTLRNGDEHYPQKKRGSMGFGQRKAHFLSIRPNARFATWIGRKKGVIEARPQLPATATQFTDHSTTSDTTRSDSVRQNKSNKNKEASLPKIKVGRDSVVAELTAIPNKTKDEYGRNEKKGNRADNPLINGVPFWTVQTGNETDEITDEDLPVDMEILERVCSGDLTLSQRPFQKTKFNPFGAMQRFKFDDALFVRDSTLFTSTIEAVISLQPDEDIQYPIQPSIQCLIKWSDKIQVAYYDPTNRGQAVGRLISESMKDVKREKVEKETN